MGTSLIALGRCHEAAAMLRDGSKLDGVGLRDRTAHDNARISMLLQLGSLYAEQGKLQRALAVYRETLHSLPKNYPPQVKSDNRTHNFQIELPEMQRENDLNRIFIGRCREFIIAWAIHWRGCISGPKQSDFIRRHSKRNPITLLLMCLMVLCWPEM